MNRYVIMVDAGYLLHQGLAIVSNKAGRKRSELEITNVPGLVSLLDQKAKSTLALADKELLRVYWYDGVSSSLTPQQRALVSVDDVQLRAGTINGTGQQKGVDSLIVTDLIELTSHHAICDAILVTGDSDLAVGIELAQRRGVRIAVLGIEDLAGGVSHSQSFEITSRADRVAYLGRTDVSPLMRYVPQPAAPANRTPQNLAPQASGGVTALATSTGVTPSAAPVPAGTPAAPAAGSQVASTSVPRRSSIALTAVEQQGIDAAVQVFVAQQASPLVNAVDAITGRIDSTVDRALLHHVYQALQLGPLTNIEKIYARQVLRSTV